MPPMRIRTVASNDFAKGFGIHSFNTGVKEGNMTTSGARIRQATKEASMEREIVGEPDIVMKPTKMNNAGFEDIFISSATTSTRARPAVAISQAKPQSQAGKNRSLDPKKNDNIRVKHSSKGAGASEARAPGAKAKGMASPVTGLKRSLKKLEAAINPSYQFGKGPAPLPVSTPVPKHCAATPAKKEPAPPPSISPVAGIKTGVSKLQDSFNPTYQYGKKAPAIPAAPTSAAASRQTKQAAPPKPPRQQGSRMRTGKRASLNMWSSMLAYPAAPSSSRANSKGTSISAHSTVAAQ